MNIVEQDALLAEKPNDDPLVGFHPLNDKTRCRVHTYWSHTFNSH
jgi:hypothetical protein